MCPKAKILNMRYVEYELGMSVFLLIYEGMSKALVIFMAFAFTPIGTGEAVNRKPCKSQTPHAICGHRVVCDFLGNSEGFAIS